MRLPRLEAIRLDYGCHSGRFQLPDEGRPIVIAGRNGSGKTTLLEAFLRTLYGFSKRKPEERRLLELRRPWSGRPAEAELELVAADGTAIVVHRDFATDQVVVRARASGEELYRGDANPAGVRSESRHYQDLVREWVGFATLEPYRATAWIAQGELVDTRLDDELLRAAAGSHRRVETALKELRDSFDELTRESIELGGRRKNRSREIENLREAAEAVEAADDDEGAAARIHPNDLRRIIRALEVHEATGAPIPEQQTQFGTPSSRDDCVVAGLRRERAELYERINRRVDAMFERGLVEDVSVATSSGIASLDEAAMRTASRSHPRSIRSTSGHSRSSMHRSRSRRGSTAGVWTVRTWCRVPGPRTPPSGTSPITAPSPSS